MFRDTQRRLHRLRVGPASYDVIFVERRYRDNHTLGVEVFLWKEGAKAAFRKFCTLTVNIEGASVRHQGEDTAFVDTHGPGAVLLDRMRREGIARPTGETAYLNDRPYPLYRFNLEAMGQRPQRTGFTVNGLPATHLNPAS